MQDIEVLEVTFRYFPDGHTETSARTFVQDDDGELVAGPTRPEGVQRDQTVALLRQALKDGRVRSVIIDERRHRKHRR